VEGRALSDLAIVVSLRGRDGVFSEILDDDQSSPP
jgi:hypothetical protein